MKQLNVIELRNSKGRLIAKYYPDKGVIEIIQKGERSILTFPIGTVVQFIPSVMSSTK